MALIEILTPKILKWEGGYVNDPLDKGGCTNMGVTLDTYKRLVNPSATCKDIATMNAKDFEKVLKTFWNRWSADEIKNQSVANILVDWVWGSGVWGIRIPQRILGVKEDGIVGPKTIAALNAANQEELFKKIFDARVKFLNDIVKNNPSQQRFIKGWLNRLNDYKFQV
ncbi:peptidoglycan domain protein [Myroides sp. 1354]|uniref:glycoside hydrolase family 108 protein n=1 Tax=unclassified Myroides TaxID=2642485 RepID=UPI0025785DFA|nr:MULTISPECIES: putative peptidoglycan-binding domain-containing protein [unclassified Myroides]MDM1045862.1 peptidoglycan domain protein [Myroides sp. R163-1]MDM1056872.1 peptidoglycan domain protein [Myroides sp. 1354]MDM1070067.1 peptidoglycan domain protein [Myroides sp. 1372]